MNVNVASRQLLAILLAASAFLIVSRISPAADSDKTYVVRLSHHSQVGEKYELTASGSRKVHSEVVVNGRPPSVSNHDISVKLEGVVEVLAIDSKGGATKISCTITKMTRTEENTDVLPAGSVVIIDETQNTGLTKEEDAKRVTLKDGTLTDAQREAIRLTLVTHKPEAPTQDEIIGPGKPQKIGATWPINAEKAATNLASRRFEVKAEDIKGDATLTGITQLAGQDYLQVKATMSTSRMKPPAQKGFTFVPSSFEARLVELVPAESGPLRTAESLDMVMKTTANGTTPNGRPFVSNTSIETHGEVECRAVK